MSGSSEQTGVAGAEASTEIVLGKQQQAALWALREGMNLGQAAEKAQVARMTLYRWLQKDPHFRAAYNLWQQEIAETARARLLKLSDRAVAVVEKQLMGGDGKLAVAVLKELGVLGRLREESSVPRVVAMEMQLRQARELHNAMRAVGGTEARLRRAGRRLLRQHAAGRVQDTFTRQNPIPEEAEEENLPPLLHDAAGGEPEPGESAEDNPPPEQD